MRPLQNSSGDLVVDRRAGFAAALARDKDFAAAAEVMAGAVEERPGWTAGWSLLGDYHAEAGNSAGAIAAYEQLARLDVDGVFGAGLKLAALGAAPAPRGTEIAYVESLFDDYAARFEAELVVGLGYGAPARLLALIEAELGRRGVEQAGHALDLGCGTGLMGERLRRRASFLEGVDLSGAMVEMACRKRVYDRVHKGELTAFLAGHAGGVDLMAAADVLNYCGALAPILGAAFGRLAPGGLFAFTLERHDGPEPMLLQASLRYAHNERAALAACREAGFEIVVSETSPLRHDRGAPVPGLLLLVRKPDRAVVAMSAAEAELAAEVAPLVAVK